MIEDAKELGTGKVSIVDDVHGNSEESMSLAVAIRKNRVDVLQSMHQQGKNIVLWREIISPLTYAVKCGSLDVCRFYLETFPALDRKLVNSAFFAAIEDDNVELSLLFLESRSKESMWIAEGDYAIHRAAASGALKCLKGLLKRGADINSRSQYLRQTPLIAASSYGQHQIVIFLLQEGADFELTDRQGCKAYHLGCFSCYAENGYYVDCLRYGDDISDIFALFELDFPMSCILDDISSKAVYDNLAPNIQPLPLFRILINSGYRSPSKYSEVLDKLVELILLDNTSKACYVKDVVYALMEESLMPKASILNIIFSFLPSHNSANLKQLPAVLACLTKVDFLK